MPTNIFPAFDRMNLADMLAQRGVTPAPVAAPAPKSAPAPAQPELIEDTGIETLEVPEWADLFPAEQHAIDTLRRVRPPQIAPARPKAGITRPLPMEYIGEISGIVSANVYCFGYATDTLPDGSDRLLYLNIAGPSRSVTAIRAALNLGEIVNIVFENGRGIGLDAGGADNEKKTDTGKFKAYEQPIPEARLRNMIMLHAAITDPKDKNPAFIHSDDATSKYRLLERVANITGCPLYDEWANFIWQTGLLSNLMRPSKGAPVTVYTISADAPGWTRLIQMGIHEHIITFPAQEK